jgi:hypothetical protein
VNRPCLQASDFAVRLLEIAARAMSPSPVSGVQRVAWEDAGERVLPIQAISTDILHFPARVLVIQAARAAHGQPALIPEAVLRIYSCAVRSPVDPLRLQTHGPVRSPWSERRAVLHGHAAATDAQLSHDADRLASIRVRRAAAARDARSAGTASPVPKYISSGVCPRNAECGSTRLCSST